MAGRVPYKINHKVPMVSNDTHTMHSPGMLGPPNVKPTHNGDRPSGGGGGRAATIAAIPQNISTTKEWTMKTVDDIDEPDEYLEMARWSLDVIQKGGVRLFIKINGIKDKDVNTALKWIWGQYVIGLAQMGGFDPAKGREIKDVIPGGKVLLRAFVFAWETNKEVTVEVRKLKTPTLQLDVFVTNRGAGRGFTGEYGEDDDIMEEEMEVKDKKTMVSDFVNTVMMTRRMAKGLNLIEEVEKMDVFM